MGFCIRHPWEIPGRDIGTCPFARLPGQSPCTPHRPALAHGLARTPPPTAGCLGPSALPAARPEHAPRALSALHERRRRALAKGPRRRAWPGNARLGGPARAHGSWGTPRRHAPGPGPTPRHWQAGRRTDHGIRCPDPAAGRRSGRCWPAGAAPWFAPTGTHYDAPTPAGPGRPLPTWPAPRSPGPGADRRSGAIAGPAPQANSRPSAACKRDADAAVHPPERRARARRLPPVNACGSAAAGGPPGRMPLHHRHGPEAMRPPARRRRHRWRWIDCLGRLAALTPRPWRRPARSEAPRQACADAVRRTHGHPAGAPQPGGLRFMSARQAPALVPCASSYENSP